MTVPGSQGQRNEDHQHKSPYIHTPSFRSLLYTNDLELVFVSAPRGLVFSSDLWPLMVLFLGATQKKPLKSAGSFELGCHQDSM